MKKSLARFRKDYESAFADYLRSPGEQPLATAYELGRRAVADEVSLLEMSEVHHQTLVGALNRNEGRVPVGDLARQAAAFFSEALSTHEILQRGYVEAQRTAQLARRHANQLRRLAAAALALSPATPAAPIDRIEALRPRPV